MAIDYSTLIELVKALFTLAVLPMVGLLWRMGSQITALDTRVELLDEELSSVRNELNKIDMTSLSVQLAQIQADLRWIRQNAERHEKELLNHRRYLNSDLNRNTSR